ncbi:MAG TPA: hypothetical protein VKP66_03940 [Steroidobacteraceae bacterium]|nr:hypothetical protein [Steroidobacteraceae bacterium]
MRHFPAGPLRVPQLIDEIALLIMLAMKRLAMRIGAEFHDEDDIRHLLRPLEVRNHRPMARRFRILSAMGIMARWNSTHRRPTY